MTLVTLVKNIKYVVPSTHTSLISFDVVSLFLLISKATTTQYIGEMLVAGCSYFSPTNWTGTGYIISQTRQQFKGERKELVRDLQLRKDEWLKYH